MSWLRRHRWIVVAVMVVLFACSSVVAAAYAYDRTHSDVIAKGIHVGRIDLSGLDANAARAKLRNTFHPLSKPLVIRYPHGHLVLTPRQAHVGVNVNQLVSLALKRSHRSWFLPRAWREVTGGRVKGSFQPRIVYSKHVVAKVVTELQKKLYKPPKDAAVVPSYNKLVLQGGHAGRAVSAKPLRQAIVKALVSRFALRHLKVTLHHVDAKVTFAALQKQYPSFITIDRNAFTLRVYQKLKFIKSYPIAVGQQGLQTPAGLYHIQDKQVDPSWHVPKSPWAGSLAGQVIPPGPADPLKARWLGIYNGAGIHGTDVLGSLGTAASHGCIRMAIPDVIELYDRTPLGTPVYIA
jgi:lipoprotein-anchoring transpeptidase ErfK/SrfK